jgi:hypothetical protein
MLDASELAPVVGYTAIASATAVGDVNGDDGELIKLDNGMIFELDGDCLLSEYSPEIIVFEWIVTPAEAKERYNKDWDEPVFLYKLVIGIQTVVC